MLKKEVDKLKKESTGAKQLREQLEFVEELANQFTELPEVRDFSWHPLDAVAFALFLTVVMLFFV